MNKDALLVLSGGMDSVTMLYDFSDSIDLAVTFNYGSNHNMREMECARYHCRNLGIELVEIDLSFIGQYFTAHSFRAPMRCLSVSMTSTT